ncbi:armadillo-type protein [Mycena galopus ATCC 62051]|nr:armadillo-type protein [Mycena galopus ATCC 62051]
MLLESPNPKTLRWTCKLVGRLASHNSAVPTILTLSVQIVSLLSNKDSGVIVWAVYALSKIAQSEDGAQAVVNAKATDYILILLQSPSTQVRESTCRLVGILSGHEFTVPAMLDVESCAQIVYLLGDVNGWVIDWAVYALSRIAQWKDGAQAIVNANATSYIPLLLEAPNSKVLSWACDLVGGLAIHEPTALAMLELKPSVQLTSLLPDHILAFFNSRDPLPHSVVSGANP